MKRRKFIKFMSGITAALTGAKVAADQPVVMGVDLGSKDYTSIVAFKPDDSLITIYDEEFRTECTSIEQTTNCFILHSDEVVDKDKFEKIALENLSKEGLVIDDPLISGDKIINKERYEQTIKKRLNSDIDPIILFSKIKNA